MKYTWIAVLGLFLVACQPAVKKTSIDFSLEGAKEDAELTIKGATYDSTFTLVEGKLMSELNLDEEAVYSFIYNRSKIQLHITPGESVKVSGKADDFPSDLTVDDANKAVLEYFNAKSEIYKKDLSLRKLISMESGEFLTSVKSGIDKISDLVSSSSLSDELKQSELENVSFAHKRFLKVYPTYSDSKLEDLEDDFKTVLDGVDLSDQDKFLRSDEYRSLVKDAFMMGMYADTSGSYEEVFMKRIDALPAGNIRNQLVYDDMKFMLGPNEQMDDMFEFFKSHNSNAKHNAEMKSQYESLQVLRKGEDSPEFDYENFIGGNTKLKEFRGKYVYIDVWATWCGPCKAEIPSLKEKEEKYKGTKLEFVSLSIDKENAYDTWRKMIKEKELGGTQLIADNAWQSDFVQDYQIKGIPRFILVDPEGKIVSADAPRPSDDRFDETVAKLAI